ncbi:MAG: PAS domain-containing sensor histidine kinase, partial [Bacteroidia bacterium]
MNPDKPHKDNRIENIHNLLVKFNIGDFSERLKVSEKGDEIDAIIIGLNSLADEAQFSGKLVKDYEKRVSAIMGILLKYTLFDFTEKAEISEAGDELDAISIGLNTLAEELVASREAEAEQLKKVEDAGKFLDNILENIPNLVFVRDAKELRYLRVNKAVEAFLGLKKEQLLGKSNYDIFPKTEADKYSNKDQEALLHIGVTDIPEELVNTKFGPRWLHTKKMPIVENGKVVYLLSISEDITQRKKNEAKLKENEERLRILIEGIRDYSIIMVDPQGYVLNWNSGAEKIKGYKAEEIMGKHISTFYTKEDVESGKPMLNLEMAKQLGRYEDASLRVRKDGTTFWADVIFTPLYNDKHELTGFSKITRDTTERKIAEDKVKQLNRELSHSVKQLENSNKELEAFSYSVSHDLRAPLRAIHGYTKILEEEYISKLDDDAKTMMESVMANAKKMGQLIDDLLAFSRLGKKEIEKKEINIEELVTVVIAELKKSTAVRAEIIIHPMPKAFADPNLLHQVIMNLLSNAVKYSSLVEKPVVEIGGYEEEDETIYYIKDNGAGFDMKYYNKLFGIFQRLHDAGEFEGTGVGLALVKRILVRHDGRVWA